MSASRPRARRRIVTPDRRLRVFVSSTLGELAAERSAVREAIVGMHLAPVMFEVGARPHAPREVYESYLQQSDVFVGVYWEQYGWVAPGMDVSGLEDEYLLSEGKPRLLYIREPAPNREPRLAALIERIEADESASYKFFQSPAELCSLVADDLAVMVTERFGSSEPVAPVAAAVETAPAPRHRPAGVTAFLVTDVVGAPEPLASVESRLATPAHEEHARRLRSVAGTHRQLVDLGDALVAVFATPSDALRCAVALQRAAAKDSRRLGVPVGVRVGIQLGEPLDERDYFGLALVQARELCAAAAPGQILVTDVVHALVAPRVGVGMRGVDAVQVTGSAALPAFEVTWRTDERPGHPAPPAVVALTSSGVFVGRTAEDARLRALWHEITAGTRRFGCIAGEPGIGKTRLVAEFARHVHDEGATVLWGRSSEELLVPYQPFVQAFQQYVESCPVSTLREQLGPAAATVERLVPGVRERLGGTAPPPSDQPESERYRLFDAVGGFLAAMADSAPVLLVLDDLQWADQASLLLLRYLLADRRPASVLLLATYRDTEVDAAHPLAAALADVRRDVPFERLHLQGLLPQDVPPLVNGMAGWSLSTDTAAQLTADTQGNPFFIGEVVRHLTELGIDDAQLRGRAWSFDDLGVPEGVQEVVERRLHRLSPPAIRALEVGSVIGFVFSQDVLAEVLSVEEDALVDAMDESVAAGLVGEHPTRAGEYVFPHALVRHAVYRRQTSAHRAALHARVGEAIERLSAGTPGEHLPELLGHFSHATGRYARKVVTYGRAAGERALAMLAYESAVTDLTSALAAATVAAPDDLAQRAELLVLLGTAQTRAGDADLARAAFREAGDAAAQCGARHTLAQAALGYGGVAGFGGVWITFGEVDDVLVGLLEKALAVHPDGDDAMRACLLSRLAQALYWSDDKGRMWSLSEEALEMARRLDDPVALAQALDCRHVAVWDADHLDEREQLAAEILRLGEQLNDRDIRLEAYAWLITDALERGSIDSVDAHIAAHTALAEELHQPYHLWYSRVEAAMRAHLDGRYDDMERLIAEAWAFGEKSHGSNALQCLHVQTLLLKSERGEVAPLVDVLAEFVEHSPLWGWRVALAWAYAQADRLDESRAELDRLAVSGLAALPHDCVSLSMLGMLADTVGRVDAVEYAAELLPLLSTYEDRLCGVGGGVLCLGPVTRYLGVLARVTGDHDAAVAYLERALKAARDLRSPPQVVAVQIEFAKALRLRDAEGDVDRARGLLAEASQVATALGMGRAVRDLPADALVP